MSDENTVLAHLQAAGVPHELVAVTGTARTAVEAAAALGSPLDTIVKSLVCLADEEPVLALVPGDCVLSLDKLAGAAGARRAKLAAGRIVKRATGYPVGGVAPFGHAQPLRVYGDLRIRRFHQVYCGAGSIFHMLRIGTRDLERLAGVTWTDLCT